MKKLKCFFGKRVFGKRSGKDGSPRPPAFRGATLDEMSRSGYTGRSMLEMLGVLAIIGVLSVAALVGFTYAMNKHRANETIYDVMLRGTNVPMVDENYASKPSGHEFRFPDLPAGTYYAMATKKDSGSSYYVEATGVTYRVCEMILKMNPTDIDQIVVNNTVYQGDSDICGTTDGLAMKFCFGEDGTICDGTGHGGSSGGSGSGSGSGSGDTDPCKDVVPSQDCSVTADVMDENGCVTVQKITCGNGMYCSVGTCINCPDAETCDGGSCCALTGPEDICGRPTKEVGTVTTVTHSDMNASGCCVETTEESCSLNPVTPRTCTPTCDGTCQSDGSCCPNCEAGYSYNEIAGQCCEDLTATPCQTLTSATSGVCPVLSNVADGTACTTTDGADGTCQSGVCEINECETQCGEIKCPCGWSCQTENYCDAPDSSGDKWQINTAYCTKRSDGYIECGVWEPGYQKDDSKWYTNGGFAYDTRWNCYFDEQDCFATSCSSSGGFLEEEIPICEYFTANYWDLFLSVNK